MLKITDKKECTGCSACYSICPTKAITMLEDEEGFVYPNIDESKCIKCGLCEKTCPCIEENKNNNFSKPEVIAAWSLDRINKEESSSGGCFYELAKYIIDQGGVVVGAAFDKELNVVHKSVERKENLIELKGSKYVQSRILDSFIRVREYLRCNKLVLFVGTPCQVAGLYAFLNNKNICNLYTVDLICHGVPSPKVYRKYLNSLEDKFSSKVKSISFRNKAFGWKEYSMKIEFKNDIIYLKNLNDDIFMNTFLSNICLRPSCYSCKFSKLPRVADITLGDFWGINNINKELDDDTGVSELVINSQKGKGLLNSIKDNIFIEKVDLENGIKYNPCLVGSVVMPTKREHFFLDLDSHSLQALQKKYFAKESSIIKFVKKVKNKLYSYIK